jgi:hypothetical protein
VITIDDISSKSKYVIGEQNAITKELRTRISHRKNPSDPATAAAGLRRSHAGQLLLNAYSQSM